MLPSIEVSFCLIALRLANHPYIVTRGPVALKNSRVALNRCTKDRFAIVSAAKPNLNQALFSIMSTDPQPNGCDF
jgi:hypothetical protein